jgi:hypothetical protein
VFARFIAVYAPNLTVPLIEQNHVQMFVQMYTLARPDCATLDVEIVCHGCTSSPFLGLRLAQLNNYIRRAATATATATNMCAAAAAAATNVE